MLHAHSRMVAIFDPRSSARRSALLWLLSFSSYIRVHSTLVSRRAETQPTSLPYITPTATPRGLPARTGGPGRR